MDGKPPEEDWAGKTVEILPNADKGFEISSKSVKSTSILEQDNAPKLKKDKGQHGRTTFADLEPETFQTASKARGLTKQDLDQWFKATHQPWVKAAGWPKPERLKKLSEEYKAVYRPEIKQAEKLLEENYEREISKIEHNIEKYKKSVKTLEGDLDKMLFYPEGVETSMKYHLGVHNLEHDFSSWQAQIEAEQLKLKEQVDLLNSKKIEKRIELDMIDKMLESPSYGPSYLKNVLKEQQRLKELSASNAPSDVAPGTNQWLGDIHEQRDKVGKMVVLTKAELEQAKEQFNQHRQREHLKDIGVTKDFDNLNSALQSENRHGTIRQWHKVLNQFDQVLNQFDHSEADRLLQGERNYYGKRQVEGGLS